MSMRSKQFRSALLGASALVGAAALAATPAAAQEARQFEFDMPAQPLTMALKAYGAAADQQLIFSERLVQGREAPPLKGAYTPDQALSMLLAGSGLVAERTPGGVVTIRSATQDPQGGSAAGGGATVEALIVTAQKREEDIQDVPIAISAFSQEDLTRSQVAGGPDLMTQVPNMTFTKTNFSSYSIQIRGIGTQAISATTDPAVAVAFNNTPFIRNRFFEQEFYDLQRVEVLRGPQGTLYGRNATAGVVNIISAKPKFFYEARLSGDVANYNSTRLEGMINIPVVEDVVALRVSGAWTKREGYSTNEITGSPIDGRDLWSTRVSLRFAPTDRIDANLIWEHFEEDDDRIRSGKQLCKTHEVTNVGGIPVTHFQGFGGSQDILFAGIQGTFSQGCVPNSLYDADSFQTPNGLSLPYYAALGAVALPVALDDPYVSRTQSRDLRVIESTVNPHYRAKTDIAELQVNFDLTDALSLTSETAWSSDFVFSTQDFNRFNTAPGAWDPLDNQGNPNLMVQRDILDLNGVFCDPQIGCADRLVAVDLSTEQSTQFSQELRLGSDFDEPFNFSLGANFLRHDAEAKYYVFINSVTLSSIVGVNGSTGDEPYIPGVSDNTHCLPHGPRPADPTVVNDLQCVYVDPNPIDSLNDRGHNYFLSKNPYKLISYAVFGEAYYNVTENLKVTAGLRWTVDKKEAPRIPSWLLAGATAGYPVEGVTEQEWREPTGRLTADWKPDLAFTDETMVYASYARGYKAGGANPPTFGVVLYSPSAARDLAAEFLERSALAPRTFEPEFVDAFEVGTKNTFADGRVTLNLAAFYYDYKDYQISQIVNRSALNLNFDAEVWGLEIEADWRPVENLKLGFKGGYENTRIADGERAIDIMDRTNGREGWIVARPFPTFPSNCVLPVSLWTGSGSLRRVGGANGGNPGPCEIAYVLGLDPLTEEAFDGLPHPEVYPGYMGFDPVTGGVDGEHNFGEGFFKNLSGNELPNAPNFTATITADYTVPLAGDWLATLHTDLYYQSEAWTRIFNTEGYDKLKAYTNVNLAAIFTNEPQGWKVMAYVKNVMDRDSITGAFLNSDDTGLTTNVFLTEPRLYGVRVTKEWIGGPLLGSFGAHGRGPAPFTLELGGQVQRWDAPYETLSPASASEFQAAIDPLTVQNRDMDWGDGREVRLTWRPSGDWSVSAGVRVGKTNTSTTAFWEALGDVDVCGFLPGDPFAKYTWCTDDLPDVDRESTLATETNWSHAEVRSREEYEVIDFEVGRDLGIGAFGLSQSKVGLGLRYAQFESETSFLMYGVDDWMIPQGWRDVVYARPAIPSSFERHEGSAGASREFEGLGPMVSWDAAVALLGDEDTGHLNVDWSARAGVLFGKQDTSVTAEGRSGYWTGNYYGTRFRRLEQVDFDDPVEVASQRSSSVTVPIVDLSLGLSYSVERFKVGAGYRWERYFDVLDVGYDEAKDGDRTIDGPYFKLSVGFGGG